MAQGKKKINNYLMPMAFIAAAIVIMLVVRLSARYGPRVPITPAAERKPMSSVSMTTLDDKPWSLADQQGKVVLVNLFATWCGPCAVETPDLVKVWHELSASGYETAGVSLDDGENAEVKKFVADYKMPYVVGKLNPMSDLARAMGTQQIPIPLSFLVDRQGRLAKVYRGMTDYEELKADVENLLKENTDTKIE